MKAGLKDGIYLVERENFVAGFSVRDGEIILCAPILKRRLPYWLTVAEWIGPLK